MAADATAQQVAIAAPEVRRVSAGLWSDAAWRLRHDPTTLIALGVMVLFVAIALSADLLATNFFHRALSQQDNVSSYEKPDGSDP